MLPSKRKVETVCQVIVPRKQRQRKCKEVANASIGLQKKQEQQDEIATILPTPKKANEEFTSMESKEPIEHINSKDTNGCDLDLTADSFIQALRARAKSYSRKDKLKIVAAVLGVYKGNILEDFNHIGCNNGISSWNAETVY